MHWEEARFRTAGKQTQEGHHFHLSYSSIDSQQAKHTHRLFIGLSIFARKVLLLLVFAVKIKQRTGNENIQAGVIHGVWSFALSTINVLKWKVSMQVMKAFRH